MSVASSSKSINAIDEVPNTNEFPFYSLKNREMKVRILVWPNFARSFLMVTVKPLFLSLNLEIVETKLLLRVKLGPHPTRM